MTQNKKRLLSGFTLVELMIVVVVLAILISVVALAYDGVHERARDTKRLNDITAIKEALQTYRASKGTYPASIAGPYRSWDASYGNPASTPFLMNLKSSGYMDVIPVDPTNTAPTSSSAVRSGYRYQYRYYTNTATLATMGCATDRGGMAVLVLVNLEKDKKKSTAEKTADPSSPGFTCTSQNFNTEGAWVWGDYDKVY